MLPSKLRRHVACFYAFARAADDIADNPELPGEEKIKRLEGFELALGGETDPVYQKAINMAESLEQTGVTSRHCRDLLAAFKQDAVKCRYQDWSELMAYCRLSAAPVGRYLIDLHGGSKLGYWTSDALCAALQLINHVQDCGEDYRHMDRVYLPANWMAEAGADFTDLGAGKASPALRQTLDWTLKGVDALLQDAGTLSGSLSCWRLGLEASVIFQIARALNKRLKNEDPLSRRIVLGKPQLMGCALKGVFYGW